MFEEIDKELYEGRGSGGGILQGLQDECQQWATRFPHLRYVTHSFLPTSWRFTSQWKMADVWSLINAVCRVTKKKPKTLNSCVIHSPVYWLCLCNSGLWGLSWCVPVMRASSGILLQEKAALPAACQQAKRPVGSPWRKIRAAQSKT